ncbi:hypothetical protein M011DRAFT_495676 [Sporormia fimetaria CBS 119925]|uniref:F1F0 ATP synthase assembly protein Atp10 n=1 Tax=Sporormia fimetaria CBS 119925 TaxID=1340428 RepID=A0A6A6V4I3_9PLEO|nr:hypothetical protein M011DRAFT_495676 [Sporormia fimetaria CBS 119925]
MMLQPRIPLTLRTAVAGGASFGLKCQRQSTFQRLSNTRQFTTAPALRRPTDAKQDPEHEAKDDEDFVPKPLGRPIGFPRPPQAGENLGTTQKKTYTGTMSERNLEKRKDIVEAWSKNYFRDFKNIRKYRGGKTFIANPKIFKREAALYFPNLHGETLVEDEADTTPVLNGKISVVNVYSSRWGEGQVQTFTSKKANPELAQVLADNKDLVQMVDVNIEENTVKVWIVYCFKWWQRRLRAKEDWNKYFVVRKGVSDRIREMIGLLNGRVGYVYLLDDRCKIRWAGSGDAEGSEADDLTKGVRKLIQEPWSKPEQTSPQMGR